MKFGAVRDRNSLNALMTGCDDHDGALRAAPKPRHHFQAAVKKDNKYQIDNECCRMIHNHPSGETTPSREDIAMTKEIESAARTLGIAMHDHIVVGRGKWVSLRREQLI